MQTDGFRAAREWLIERAAESRTAVMCAESLWWRCHRRLLADSLVAAGCVVRHIMSDTPLDVHRLHPVARVEDGLPVYDVSSSQGRLIQ
jgi:uncharacterized protein (DUF488 family)